MIDQSHKNTRQDANGSLPYLTLHHLQNGAGLRVLGAARSGWDEMRLGSINMRVLHNTNLIHALLNRATQRGPWGPRHGDQLRSPGSH